MPNQFFQDSYTPSYLLPNLNVKKEKKLMNNLKTERLVLVNE